MLGKLIDILRSFLIKRCYGNERQSIVIPQTETLIETKFEKSRVTDTLKGYQFNFCPVHFLHLFTAGAIFNRVSEGYRHY